MMDIPTFGVKEKNIQYEERPSAYGILSDDARQIAIVEYRGRYFLPGGGIDAGETPEDCVRRETLEEIGFAISGLRFLGEAVDYFQSIKNKKYYYIPASYFVVDHFKPVQEPVETDHILHWKKPEGVINKMARAGFTWAIQQAIDRGHTRI